MSDPTGPDLDPPLSAVFVYGTLRPGRANWAVLREHCSAHEPARLPGYGLYALAHPVVAPLAEAPADGSEGPGRSPGPAGGGVRGDLVRLHRDEVGPALVRLDAFEGVDPIRRERSYYERVRCAVVTDDGTAHDAWVYLPGAELRAQVREARRVPDDDWPG